jgi:hypothetical protein
MQWFNKKGLTAITLGKKKITLMLSAVHSLSYMIFYTKVAIKKYVQAACNAF